MIETKNNPSFAITNVRVFDGSKLTELQTVFVENGMISDETSSNITIDGRGFTLLPGFIDSHIHLDNIENLRQAAKYGVTTMLDMATADTELVNSLRNQPGLTDIRSCYLATTAPYSSLVGGAFGAGADMPFKEVTTLDEAMEAENEQLSKGADYIKVIIEEPPMTEKTLSTEIMNAIVENAHKNNKLVFAHTTSSHAFQEAIDGGIDVLNHLPRNEVMPQHIIDSIIEKGKCLIPTMIMQKGMVESMKKIMPDRAGDYEKTKKSLQMMYQSGVTIIAGTDANFTNAMNHVPHGISMHEELELMVEAGLTPVDALKSATITPAQVFGFIQDRGAIKSGLRADFILVKGDPTKDIAATRNIEGVWINGIKVNVK